MKGFHIYIIAFWYLFIPTVLAVFRRSCWSTGMIASKVIWGQFPARISTLYSKLLPVNDLIFQFSIKHLHICSYKFSYRISHQKIWSAILCNFCNFCFLQYVQSFMLIWLFQEKSYFSLNVCKVLNSVYKYYVICISSVNLSLFGPISEMDWCQWYLFFYLGFCLLVFL